MEPSSTPRMGAMASSSSMNMIDGAHCRAFLNISLIAFSDSPTHLENNWGPLMLMKFAADSLAIALAMRVFPVPGGPYSKMPFSEWMPIRVNVSGLRNGHSTASMISWRTSSNPPTSLQETFGISMKISRSADGSTSFNALKKSALVTFIFSSISLGISASSRSIFGRYLRNVFIAASLTRADISAPTKPCVWSASSSTFTSSANGIPLA